MKRIYNPLAEMRKLGWKEGYKEGYEEGIKKVQKKEICLILLKEGTCSEKKIASLLEMPLSRAKKLKKTMLA